jgi:hypothetical protein
MRSTTLFALKKVLMTVSVTYPREQTAGFGGLTICPNVFPPKGQRIEVYHKNFQEI